MIYISEFKVLDSIERENEYERVLRSILDFLERKSIGYFRSADFTSYQEIEEKIDRSDKIISLIDTQLMLDNAMLTSAMNRIYYAMFYAVQAVLITKNVSFSKHGQVKGKDIQSSL
jgi:hypothetical protein